MKPKAAGVLVVMVFLFGIITIIQPNLAFAASSEKIFLIQKFEQFPGQKITGFCNLQFDDQGNLNWRIKVNGLLPETQGHFDLGHWAGEGDVSFTANDDGKADSKNQIIHAKEFSQLLFSQFAKCQVHTSDDIHFSSVVIALGVPGSGNEDVDENKKPIQNEKKFFLFETLEYVFAMFTNNDFVKEPTNPVQSEKNSPNLQVENKKGSDTFLGLDLIFGPPPPNESSNSDISADKASDKTPDKASDKVPDKASDKTPTDKASDKVPDKASDKTPTDKASDKTPTDKASDKVPDKASDKVPDKASDKTPTDKASDKTPTDKGKGGNKGNSKK